MAHIALETTIMAPVGASLNVLRNPSRRPEWMTNLHEVRNVTGDQVNDSWEYTYTMLGRSFTGKITVLEAETPQTVKLALSGGITGTQEWRLTPTPEGMTLLRFVFDYTVPVVLGGGLTDKLFIERQNERQLRSSLENLKHLVEHEHGTQLEEREA
jgi:uncharacterized membrane protein